MRFLTLTGWLVGLVALLWVGSAYADAIPEISIVRVPVDISIDNLCTGETVDLNGELHLNNALVLAGNGGIHEHSMLLVANLVGVGETSGIVYQGIINSSQVLNIDGRGLPFEATQTVTINLVSQGSADNLIAHIILHLTINAAGEATAEVAHAVLGCRG
jgi:hypothetical protein